MENCAAWGRYSSPKAATIDLDVRHTNQKKLKQSALQKLNFNIAMNTFAYFDEICTIFCVWPEYGLNKVYL